MKKYIITNKITMNHGKKAKGLGISLIPAIIYSQMFAQTFFEAYSVASRIAASILVISAYLMISQIPYVCIAVALANAILYIGLGWTAFDKIDAMWIRNIFKAGYMILVMLLEIGICSIVMGKKRNVAC